MSGDANPLQPCPPPKNRLVALVTNCHRASVAFGASPERVAAVVAQALPQVRGLAIGRPEQVTTDGLAATAAYRVYFFLDDVQTLVVPEGSGAVLHLRSAARTGNNDFGVNRRRVARIIAAVQTELAG